MPMQIFRETNQEKGLALILAIGFLAILSIIGAVVLSTATRDLGASATFQPNQRAFYTADRAVEYSLNPGVTSQLDDVGETVNLADSTVIATDAVGNSLGKSHKAIIESIAAGTTLQSGSITYLGPTDPVPNHIAKLHSTEVSANQYHVQVQATSVGVGVSRVDANIVELTGVDASNVGGGGGSGRGQGF